jgi:hypothetical protein
MSEPVHTIVVDWDGTAVPNTWPERPTEFMPGFERSMRILRKQGYRLTIFSARYTPYNPYTGEPQTDERIEEIAYIRRMLDEHGLGFVDIWTQHGKPSGAVYVDDKAVYYAGCPNCWDTVTGTIIGRLVNVEPLFPAIPYEEVAS